MTDMNMKLVTVDGSQGEGGGQMLRTSLSLGAIYGKPFEMVNIRSGRPVPGLKRQHLTCVRATAEICDAEVTGDEVGSMHLTFIPGAIKPGKYCFDIGTAGSVTLVAQTILPVLLLADGPSEVTIRGGTHVPFAPTWDFFERTYLPQLEAMGAQVEARLESYGYYPVGGGEVVLRITPLESVYPYVQTERGRCLGGDVVARVAGLSRQIAEDEARIIREALPELDLNIDIREVDAACSGNDCLVRLDYENVSLVFSEIGNRNKKRGEVAKSVVDKVRAYLGSGRFMERHLADQVLVPLTAFLGRKGDPEGVEWDFGAPEVETLHYRTNRDVIRLFAE